MKAVIIEDELLAYEELLWLLGQVDPEIQVIKHLTSVEDAEIWFRRGITVDVIFMDIQLSDGLSFNIFEVVDLRAPVIFTTAFDQYALNAFKVKGLDYLLKPIDEAELGKSIKHLKKSFLPVSRQDFTELREAVESSKPVYKSRFSVRSGSSSIKVIEVGKVAYFEVEGNYVTMFDNTGKMYPIDYRMDEILTLLSPSNFFRISRQHIINIAAIREVEPYPGSRFAIKMICPAPKPIIVSAGRTREFKEWLEDN